MNIFRKAASVGRKKKYYSLLLPKLLIRSHYWLRPSKKIVSFLSGITKNMRQQVFIIYYFVVFCYFPKYRFMNPLLPTKQQLNTASFSSLELIQLVSILVLSASFSYRFLITQEVVTFNFQYSASFVIWKIHHQYTAISDLYNLEQQEFLYHFQSLF